MKIEISKPAWFEILEAQDYYNLQKDGLGNIFKYEVKKTFVSIEKFPNLYPNITKNIKRCLLYKFPYTVFYSLIENEKILILSVAHQKKKPRY
ncbi:type II toxin-antitoxin system RelE/ParE family toxin [Arcobacter vandammei]|uniref:type II toxin-antitoxin system RelE/ParE family toxin n=1 Tax=Arcobacter vandammei TaxID=2782243 RepID=UPI0018DF721F|nr:type II toxin-antitoxin system RelE/ParE family toxin [Arcobacter vandammei]